MSRKEIALKYVITIVVVGVLLCLSVLANMQNIIYPFALPMALALVFGGVKGYIVAPLYFACSLLSGVSESSLIMAGYASAVILLAGLVAYKGGGVRWWVGCVFVAVAHFAFLYYNVYLGAEYLESGLTVAVAMLTFVCARRFFRAVRTHPLAFKFTLDESICGYFVLLVVASGLAGVDAVYFSAYHLVGVFAVLACAYVFGKTETVIIAVVYGLGYAINTLQVGYVALFAGLALAVVSLKSGYKLYSIFIALIVGVLFGMYFELGVPYNLTSLAEAGVACLLFACVPNKVLQCVSGYINADERCFGVKSIVERNNATLQHKLRELSNVFAEMDIVFRKMIKGMLPAEDAKAMLANETCQKLCAECSERGKCFRSKQNMGDIIFDLITIGFERGRVTLLDIPPALTNYCLKTSQMLIIINQLITQYKQYANMITDLDSSRLLLAEQLNGVARIMRDLSEQIDEKIVFDDGKESRLIEELALSDVVCNDAVVYMKDNYTTNVNLLVRNQDATNPAIKAVVSKVCGCVLDVKDVQPSEISGWVMINLCTATNFDVLFGYAGKCKNGENVSGDNYSLLRLNDSKFMMAICDGMGSGQKAGKTSELAISLVENFYKAGFDNEIILNCVNKLLAINNEENFTALDLCVIDLKNCFADFIKLGAPAGVVKHRNTATIINGGSLPIGILEEMKPACYKTVLSDQDMIVLCSDGVADAFKTAENFKNFVNNVQTLHPQRLADEILKSALQLTNGIANDDMTVVVGRVFQKY